MTTAIYHNIIRPTSKWIKDDQTPCGRNVQTGQERLTVRVDVDMDGIAKRIGKQAAGNKKAVSKFLHGLIRVEILERKQEP